MYYQQFGQNLEYMHIFACYNPKEMLAWHLYKRLRRYCASFTYTYAHRHNMLSQFLAAHHSSFLFLFWCRVLAHALSLAGLLTAYCSLRRKRPSSMEETTIVPDLKYG